MVKIKEIGDKDVLDVKVNHVLRCFTDYRYHKYAINMIQKGLEYIATELNHGSTPGSIVNATSDAKHNSPPWENELLSRESMLIKEQDKHITETDQVEEWLANIKNSNHKAIVIEYLINNRCENAEQVADKCFTTSGNVCKVAQRYVENIARRIT